MLSLGHVRSRQIGQYAKVNDLWNILTQTFYSFVKISLDEQNMLLRGSKMCSKQYLNPYRCTLRPLHFKYFLHLEFVSRNRNFLDKTLAARLLRQELIWIHYNIFISSIQEQNGITSHICQTVFTITQTL